MADQLDIDDLIPREPEHAPKPPAEEDLSIIVAPIVIPDRKALVDTKFVAALRSVIKQVKELVVKDGPSLQLAVNLQSRLTEAKKKLQAAHDEMKAPFLTVGRAIDQAIVGPNAQIEEAVQILRKAQVDFARAEADRVAKEQKERQAEIDRKQAAVNAEKVRQEKEAAARLEEARLNEEADARARAAQTPQQAANALDIDEVAPPEPEPLPPAPPPAKSAAQIELERVLHAPAPVAAKAVGVQMRTTLEIEAVDVDKLPEPFVTRTANLQALKAAYCVKWTPEKPIPVVEGVIFVRKELPVTRVPRV
jgi:hypothetical protein